MTRKICPALVVLTAIAVAQPAAAVIAPIDRRASVDASTLTTQWTGPAVISASGFFRYRAANPATSCAPRTPVTVNSQNTPAGQTPAVPVTLPYNDLMDHCDITHVHTASGKLDITLPAAGDGIRSDWDLHVYRSNQAGDWGPLIGSSINSGDPESISIPVAGGWYLVNAVPFTVLAESYTGALAFTPLF